MIRHTPIALAWTAVVALLGPSAGCGTPSTEGDSEETGAESGEFVDLIDHAQWIQIDAPDDPLADHRPATVECSNAGWYPEDDGLEVDTNFCNYLAVAQPSLAALTKGKRFRLFLYHFNLTAIEPALAHVALVVGGELLWEQEIEIPGDAKVYELELESPIDKAAGEPLVFHLHNHGQNTWVLLELSAEQ